MAGSGNTEAGKEDNFIAAQRREQQRGDLNAPCEHRLMGYQLAVIVLFRFLEIFKRRLFNWTRHFLLLFVDFLEANWPNDSMFANEL